MIEFTIKIEEQLESALIEFSCESKDAPDATKGEFETAKALNIMLAAFKEHQAGLKDVPKSRIISN
jgi:hypothetical protein